MLSALDGLEADVASGAFAPHAADEDVHTALERGLTERLGVLGGKLRAGRSRNDQVATDFRLFLRDHARFVAAAVVELQRALLEQSLRHVDARGAGVHPPSARSAGVVRARARQARPRVRARRRPAARLGPAYGALARWARARSPDRRCRSTPRPSRSSWGSAARSANSIDAVSDRDFVAEFCFATAMIGVHLSRLGEEICLWTSREFGWATLDDAWSTGCSIMPQKKNPDVAELARGKSGRLIGELTGLLTMLKGLPFAYNRDLQEDKEPVFDAIDTLLLVLPAMTGCVATLRFDVERMADSAPQGFALATDIAEWLVRQGVPFREAHEVAGGCVRRAEARGVELWDLTDDELRSISDHLTPAVRGVLSVRGALDSRSAFGGTAPARVREQLADVSAVVDADAEWAASRPGA